MAQPFGFVGGGTDRVHERSPDPGLFQLVQSFEGGSARAGHHILECAGVQPGFQHKEGLRAEEEPAGADCGVVHQHLVRGVEGAEFARQLVEVEAQEMRAQGVGGQTDGVGEADELAREGYLAGRLKRRDRRGLGEGGDL